MKKFQSSTIRTNQQEEKTPFSLEEEDSYRKEIKSIVTQINAEISVNDPESKYLVSLNSMFDLFESTYHKNVNLMEACKDMNNAILKNASKVKILLDQSNEFQESICRLKSEYENATAEASKVRELENQSRETVRNLRNQISQFGKDIEVKEKEGTANQEVQIDQLRSEISQLQEEVESSHDELTLLKNQFKTKRRDYETTIEINRKYHEEFEQNSNTIEGWDQSIEEMRVNNRKTKADLEIAIIESENANKEIDTTELDNQIAKNQELEKNLHSLDMDITRLQVEYENIINKQSKKQVELRKIQRESDSKQGQLEGVKENYQKRIEQAENLTKTIETLNKEQQQGVPQYKELIQQYSEVSKKKTEMLSKSKDLQNQLYNLQLKQSKSEALNRSEVRKASATKMDLTQMEHRHKDEEMKTLEVVGQKQTLIYEQMVEKQKKCDLKKKMEMVNNEIDENQTSQKLANSNYLMVSDLLKRNEQENNSLIEELGSIRKQTELKISQIEHLKENRNSIKKQYEMAVKEHQHLDSQYQELVDSIRTMTERVEQISQETAHDHFFANEMKVAIASLNEMRTQTMNGIKTTSKVINNLQGEEQTLNRIIEKTTSDHYNNLKELESLRESKTELHNQIAEKDREIEDKTNEIKVTEALLHKRANDFDGIMKQINSLNDELDKEYENTERLEKQIRYLNDLKMNFLTLSQHMMVANVRKTALYQESSIPRAFHRWLEIDAYDHERFLNIRLVDHLNEKLNSANNEYRKLIEAKEELVAKNEKMKQKNNNTITNSETQMYIDALKEDLEEKDKLIKILQEKIGEAKNDIDNAQTGMKTVRKSISERKEVTFNLQNSIERSLRRGARSQRLRRSFNEQMNNSSESNAYNDVYVPSFITEPPITSPSEHGMSVSAVRSLGGGFKPHPPRSPRTGAPPIPKLKIEEIDTLNPLPPPNSQRYQRPNIGSLRKKLARPIQTARNDRTRKPARIPIV